MSVASDTAAEARARRRRAVPKFIASVLLIGVLVVGGVWHLRGESLQTTRGDAGPEAAEGSNPPAVRDVRPHADPGLLRAPATGSAHASAAPAGSAGTQHEDGSTETQGSPEGSEAPNGPVIARAYTAAMAGRWTDAVRWLDEELAQAPPGTTRDRLATLRVHLLMEFGPRADGALALAALLSDAASAMDRGRFAVASAPDPNRAPEDCTILAGPFVVAAPGSGWVKGGSSFFRMMRGHTLDSGGRDAPRLRTEDAYLASLPTFVTSALIDVAKDDAVARGVLEATRAFIELNERIRREGADRVRPQSTAPLRDDVVAFVRAYGSSADLGVQCFTRFLVQAFPGWANQALHPPPR